MTRANASDGVEEPLLMVRLNYIGDGGKFRCTNKPAAKVAKSSGAALGFNPSPVGDSVDFQNAERYVALRRGTPMRSKMDLSIHRLKARSFRFSVTAIAFLNVGPADSICVAESEKNFICATVPILFLKIETAGIYCRYKSERFNACPSSPIKKTRARGPRHRAV